MTPTRAAVATGIVLAATTLAGCGSNDLSPHTRACRSYELHAGSASAALTTNVVDYLSGDLGIASAITYDVGTIRSAAVDAGLTRNLGQADYQVFKTLVDAVDRFVVQIASADDSAPFDASVPVPVQKAVKAVSRTCS